MPRQRIKTRDMSSSGGDRRRNDVGRTGGRVAVNSRLVSVNRPSDGRTGIRATIKEYGIGGCLDTASSWLECHQWIMVSVAAIAIVVGMMTSKYVTVGTSLLLLTVGYLMESRDADGDSMMTYVAAVVAFIVPFMY